ncbi:hypothetical protein ALC57_15621 [Trachymyrmex cornetzi]|uniref:Uncharacterized protein n=1 Tax=Trachymyrmex cornetzi TaxID=471704 RepID=A0A151IWM7_9HYME|nr:hypothetical protein ALC57_15621 [Trachymyrmex cornetzi]
MSTFQTSHHLMVFIILTEDGKIMKQMPHSSVPFVGLLGCITSIVLTSFMESTMCCTISSVESTSKGYSSTSVARSRGLPDSISIAKSTSSPLDSLPESTSS